MVTVSPGHRIETDQVTNAIVPGLGPLSRAEHRRPVVMGRNVSPHLGVNLQEWYQLGRVWNMHVELRPHGR
jgi:hypothetical protein